MGDDIASWHSCGQGKRIVCSSFVCHRRLQDQPRVNVAAGGTAVIRGTENESRGYDAFWDQFPIDC